MAIGGVSNHLCMLLQGGFQTVFICFYEGGSKLPLYVTMRGDGNYPCMLQQGGFKTPHVSLYEGGS